MTGNGHVIVVDEQFDVQVLGDRVSGCLGIAAFLLGPVAPKQHHGFIRMCRGNAVDVTPQVTETPRTEKNAPGVVTLRVSVQTASVLPVVEQFFRVLVPVQHRHEVLNRHPVASLVEIHGIDGIRSFHKSVHDEQFRHYVVGAPRVSAQAFGVGVSREKDDAVAGDSDIGRQLG